MVLPDDSAQPILAALDSAARTVRVKMFVFSDPSLLKAVIAARRRGIRVRVMLNPARRSGKHDNDITTGLVSRTGKGPDLPASHAQTREAGGGRWWHLRLHGKMLLADGVAAMDSTIRKRR
jgi:phosphatidylserine/phosphatidylglycerophosphate/cardiolipin synthase-like enzyme